MLLSEIVIYQDRIASCLKDHKLWIVSGIEWMKDLVNDGKATVRATGGYPDTYTALACDVLPLIANGPPPLPAVQGGNLIDSVGRGWHRFDDVVFHFDRIAVRRIEDLLS